MNEQVRLFAEEKRFRMASMNIFKKYLKHIWQQEGHTVTLLVFNVV